MAVEPEIPTDIPPAIDPITFAPAFKVSVPAEIVFSTAEPAAFTAMSAALTILSPTPDTAKNIIIVIIQLNISNKNFRGIQ